PAAAEKAASAVSPERRVQREQQKEPREPSRCARQRPPRLGGIPRLHSAATKESSLGFQR
ncbi:hypothetical protein JRQ81_010052, partial [Phrynocephalus forsythii]